MFLPVLTAPALRGRSTQSFFLWVMAPQFSHAPLRNLVAWKVLTPRLYQSPPSSDVRLNAFWCFRPGLF